MAAYWSSLERSWKWTVAQGALRGGEGPGGQYPPPRPLNHTPQGCTCRPSPPRRSVARAARTSPGWRPPRALAPQHRLQGMRKHGVCCCLKKAENHAKMAEHNLGEMTEKNRTKAQVLRQVGVLLDLPPDARLARGALRPWTLHVRRGANPATQAFRGLLNPRH